MNVCALYMLTAIPVDSRNERVCFQGVVFSQMLGKTTKQN